MKAWIVFAILSAIFAGLTAVIAKLGLNGISGDLGLGVRTIFVFVFVMTTTLVIVPMKQWTTLHASNYGWLGLSAVTTSLSWIFYYKALKQGEVSTVALIDKASILVAVVLAAVLFKEPITRSKILGGCLILGGVAIIARR